MKAARDDYGIQGRPTNNSRVAMMTGLSRREVARVRDQLLEGDDGSDNLQGNQISRVLTGWHVDSEFADSDGRPKDLPVTGTTGSLSSLFKRYAGDLPHGALRKELQQRGLVEELSTGEIRVLKRDYVYSELDPEIIRRMGVALHDHAATLEHNLNEDRKTEPRFEAMADNAKLSPRAIHTFQKLVESQGLAFLEEMDSWLSDHEIENTPDTDTSSIRLGVGVYLIYDELNQG